MKILPDGVKPIRRTAEFDESTIPKGLLKAHNTKAGVWGKIVVLEGLLQYTINEPVEEIVILEVGKMGIVEPTIRHEVKALAAVRFYVEFYQ